MIADMAEVKKRVDLDTNSILYGWGCDACGWKDFLPNGYADAYSPVR